MAKGKRIIAVDIDDSRSFVTGNFRVPGQAEKMESILRLHEKVLRSQDGCVIYTTDFHCERWWEFQENGGPYPRHNVVNAANDDENSRPMPALEALYRRYNPVIFCPLHVRCQREIGIAEFGDDDLRKSFGVDRLWNPLEKGLREKVVYALKIYFDATRIRGESEDANVFTLLSRMRELPDGEGIRFLVTGVVNNICVLSTVVGLRQLFPRSRVEVVRDCISPFVPAGFNENDVVVSVEKSLESGFFCEFVTSEGVRF